MARSEASNQTPHQNGWGQAAGAAMTGQPQQHQEHQEHRQRRQQRKWQQWQSRAGPHASHHAGWSSGNPNLGQSQAEEMRGQYHHLGGGSSNIDNGHGNGHGNDHVNRHVDGHVNGHVNGHVHGHFDGHVDGHVHSHGGGNGDGNGAWTSMSDYSRVVSSNSSDSTRTITGQHHQQRRRDGSNPYLLERFLEEQQDNLPARLYTTGDDAGRGDAR